MEKHHKDLLRMLHLDSLRRSTPSAFIASGGYTMHIKPFKDDTANGLIHCIKTFIKGQEGFANHCSNSSGLQVTKSNYNQVKVKVGPASFITSSFTDFINQWQKLGLPIPIIETIK